MKKKAFLLVLLVLCSMLAIAAQPSAEKVQQKTQVPYVQNDNSTSLNNIMYSLRNLYAFLDTNFLYEIDNTEMQYELIEAMINSLGDKYTFFVRPEDAEEYEEETTGNYVGIGTYLTKMNPAYYDAESPETYMVIITSPFPGGPADRAGLRARDMISAVNGEDISELTAAEASKLIRGKEGEPITLTVHRGDSVFDITLLPEVVNVPTTGKQMLGDNIGYIRIYEFNTSTYDKFYSDISSLLDSGATGLIIDLRNNPGGIIDSALSIANLFIDEGTLLHSQYSKNSSQKDTIYSASKFLIVDKDFPIVLLVNGGSASSSEILTAALKDNNRAKVVGSKTFGKGIMQAVIPYMDGFINITTANYLTPNGSNIHEIGIVPDVVVEDIEYTDDEMNAYAAFLQTDKISSWIDLHPEYSIENVEAFAEENADSGVPHLLLCLLIRNEYIYSIDVESRPVVDQDFDYQMKKAIEVIKEMR